MGLKVTYLSGDAKGRVLSFDSSKELITFGRGVDCDVQLPEEMTKVSHSHFSLQAKPGTGTYQFVISREKPVIRHGRAVMDGEELGAMSDVQLSDEHGPRFSIERVDARSSNAMKTEKLQTTSDIYGKVREGGSQLRMLSIAGVFAVAIAALGWFLLREDTQEIAATQEQTAQQLADAQAQLDAMRTEFKERLTGSSTATGDFTSVIERAKASVYLVVQLDKNGNATNSATAWVVARPDGSKVLATNSHVAALYYELTQIPELAGGKLVVRSQIPPYDEIEIVEAIQHPGYNAFDQMYQALIPQFNNGEVTPFYVAPSYDVALLIAKEPDRLAAPLPIATGEQLDQLLPGQQIAFIGYPARNLIGFNMEKPTATFQQAVITSLTDFFLTKDDKGAGQLVQHSLPATGGASGSPIFNKDGVVIALLNAGNVDEVGNPLAALVNYGQRVDLLRELLEGTADTRMAAYQAEWQAAVARLTRDLSSQIASLEDAFRQANPDATVLLQENASANTPDPAFNGGQVKWYDFELKRGQTYFFLATSGATPRRDIDVWVINQQTGDVIDSDTALNGFPSVTITVPNNLKVRLAVVAADAGPDGTPSRDPSPFAFTALVAGARTN